MHQHVVARVCSFVSNDSEGGRRAQAVVAGLMDALAGPDYVVTRKINDPSRKVPGDVAVRASEDENQWERILEVRDKPVTREDLITLASRAADVAIGEVTMVAIAAAQSDIPVDEACKWAAQRNVSLSFFREWGPLVRQTLLWAKTPALAAAKKVPGYVLNRLVALEVSDATASAWAALFSQERGEDRGS